MNYKEEKKNQKITVCCTINQKKKLIHDANQLNMPLSCYTSDKLFNGPERNRYFKRKVCKTIVTVGKHLDEIYNLIEESETGFIPVERLLPP